MEKLFQKARAGILEEPPRPNWEGAAAVGFAGGFHQSSMVPKAAPLKGQQGESKHPRVLPSLLTVACRPRCRCCQTLPGWAGLAAKTQEVPRAEGYRPLSPCLTAC